PPAPPSLFQPKLLTNGLFQVTLLGAPGRSYIMDASTNVNSAPWHPIATNMTDQAGSWTFIDPIIPDLPTRFYRARLQE
ncbi:MAG TPA: hypothetical protein VJS65_13945, partial [Verrucomicrobiae bacterium]|nr:hypothetical protein [Verrucomicrobiae bacterium]